MSVGGAEGDAERRDAREVLAYGVDVGGTKVLGVVLGPDGTILAERKVATPRQVVQTAARHQAVADQAVADQAVADQAVADQAVADQAVADQASSAPHPGDSIADAVASLVVALRDDARDLGIGPVGIGPVGIGPVGIGIAGMVDDAGVLRFSPNLAAAKGADVGALVAERLDAQFAADVDVAVDGVAVHAYNDANCAALAELRFGAAQGMGYGLMVTLGTGIGGALVVGGSVCAGASGFAGEIGHMVVDPNGPPCPCGGRGCWERFASGGGLARLAREGALAGTLDGAVRRGGGEPELVRGEHVTAAAAAGDASALRVVEELGWWVGLGLANLVALLDPERIVVGGGLVQAGEMLLGPSRTALAALVEGGAARGTVPVVAAALGERAGAIGAALAARAGSLAAA